MKGYSLMGYAHLHTIYMCVFFILFLFYIEQLWGGGAFRIAENSSLELHKEVQEGRKEIWFKDLV